MSRKTTTTIESCIKRERSSRVSAGAGNKRASGREGLILPKEKEEGEPGRGEGKQDIRERESVDGRTRGINGDAGEAREAGERD